MIFKILEALIFFLSASFHSLITLANGKQQTEQDKLQPKIPGDSANDDDDDDES